MTPAVEAAITALKDLGPAAQEEAYRLCEAWVARWGETDAKSTTVGVEVPWFRWLDEDLLIYGFVDRLARLDGDLYVCEWKSTRPSRTWDETRWLEGRQRSSAVAFYGLGLQGGTFLTRAGPLRPLSGLPLVLCRAATKANPVSFWPTIAASGFFQLGPERLEKAAAAIGAAAMIGYYDPVPLGMPGEHCEDRYGHLCEFLDECMSARIARVEEKAERRSWPEFEAVRAAAMTERTGVHQIAPDGPCVSFSPSSYDKYEQCRERWRLHTLGYSAPVDSIDAQIGKAFHAGLAAHYRTSMEESNGN